MRLKNLYTNKFSHKEFFALFWLICVGIGLFTSSAVSSTEFFVSLEGSDSNTGKNQSSAFRTIQKGINSLTAGDVLTVAPGEYHEAVAIGSFGDSSLETVIRAEIPGTAVLRGDTPIQNFAKVPGTEFTWVTHCEEKPQSVNELDTLTILTATAVLSELEFTPSRYYYDAASKKLYLSTSDFQAAAKHNYSISQIAKNGITIQNSQRIRIQGLGVTGFNTSKDLGTPANTAWGIWVQNSSHCQIIDCTAFLNGGGIATYSRKLGKGMLGGDIKGEAHGGNNLIENCKAYANYSIFSSEGGNIIALQPNGDEIRNSKAFLGKNHGIRLYGNHYSPSRLVGNIAWGHELPDLRIKGQDVKLGSIENCIALGTLQAPDSRVQSSLIGRRNRSTAANSIELSNESQLNQENEFADPANLDFRLQSVSRFRKKNDEAVDRGPFSYKEDVFYLHPEGNDEADGLSMQTAWKTLNTALSKLRPGQTLYLSPGTHQHTKTIFENSSEITIRGRGNEQVAINGPVEIMHCGSVVLENLIFKDAVVVTHSKDISFKNCSFQGSAEFALSAVSTNNIKVTHCDFTNFSGAAVFLSNSNSAFLSSNLYNNSQGAALRLNPESSVAYSDYNGYQNPSNILVENEKITSLFEVQSIGQDRYSRQLDPHNQKRPFFGGRLGLPLGPYRERQLAWSPLRVIQPQLHSINTTTANIEWRSSQPAKYSVSWGTTPERSAKMELDVDYFATVSLKDLKPGEKYYFKIDRVVLREDLRDDLTPSNTTSEFPPLSFTTLASDREPETWHVAITGDDKNDGMSLQTAWRSLGKASQEARPGDTVHVYEGTYIETVRLRSTGTPGSPITFKAASPGAVEIQGGNRTLTTAFSIQDKSHIRIDGFHFKKFGFDFAPSSWPIAFNRGIFDIYKGAHIDITRCLSDGRGGGAIYPPPFLKTYQSKNIRMDHCVVVSGFVGLQVNETNDLLIQNCVLLAPLVHAAVLIDSKVGLFSSIVSDNKASKASVWLIELSGSDVLTEANNCFFLRTPDENRKLISLGAWNPRPKRLGLEEFYKQIGKESGNSVFMDPNLAFSKGTQVSNQFPIDSLSAKPASLDFKDFFSENATLVDRKIGLLPEKLKEATAKNSP